MIDAFARFRQLEPSATLTIAGFGSEEVALRRQAAAAAGDAVRFVGKVDQQAMAELHAGHDIFVNASVVDNQPVSILEAFASGLPVVSSATGDIPFMVRDGETGVLTPPGDPAALAHALSAVWRDPQGARDRARRARGDVDAFTWTAVRDRWAQVYAESTPLHEIAIAAEPR